MCRDIGRPSEIGVRNSERVIALIGVWKTSSSPKVSMGGGGGGGG